MKHCVQYPDDKFFAVRPCLVGICLGNRAAGKLLGALLYRYNLRVENKDDAENHNAVKAAQGKRPDQDTSYRIFRKQSQLVEDMCGEIDEKTLHNVAVPMLQILGFLDIEEHIQTNCYIVNVDLVQQALDLYVPGHKKQPEILAFIKEHGQLEKFLINPEQLENFLIDRKVFLSGLENVLIWNRKLSNCKRGRKPRPKADAEAISQPPQNTEEESKNTREETRNASAIASAAPTPFSFEHVYYNLPMPTTYEEAANYLIPHGGTRDMHSNEVLPLAIKLWMEAHEQEEQAEQVHIALTEPQEQEKAGQNEHTDLARHSSNLQHRAESHRDRTENLGLGTQQQEVSEVTQANHVAAVPSGRAKEVPAEEQKTPPRPRRTPPVHKEAQPEKQSNLLDCPLTEPDMSGAWDAEKCVQYAEWCNNKRYKDAVRRSQVEAARKLHSKDDDITLAQFKLAYDDWKRWWDEKGKGSMHVSDLMVKQDNGFLRYQNALERLATAANKKPKTTTTSGDKPRASVLVSEEQARKNMDKMRANVAAKQAALAASGK